MTIINEVGIIRGIPQQEKKKKICKNVVYGQFKTVFTRIF